MVRKWKYAENKRRVNGNSRVRGVFKVGEQANMSQLFVGRLPRGTRARDLEDIFYKYGKMTRCDVKQGQLHSKPLRVAQNGGFVFCLSCSPFLLFVAGVKMGEL